MRCDHGLDPAAHRPRAVTILNEAPSPAIRSAQANVIMVQSGISGMIARRAMGRRLRNEHVVMMMLALESEQVRPAAPGA